MTVVDGDAHTNNNANADGANVVADNADTKSVQSLDYNTPGLILTRKIFLWAYVIGVIGVLIAAVVLIATLPKRCPKERDWYQQNVMYKVYVPSFKDSDGDGIGDLAGVLSKLDYIAKLNVKTLWLSQLFAAPTTGINPDMMGSNFTGIDPELGTMDDLTKLIKAVHKRKMKIMLDFFPTSTSNNNSWFLESRTSVNNPKSNWYVWENPVNGGPPKVNWSLTDSSNAKWEYDSLRSQYYLYYTVKERPELNFKSSSLRNETKKLFTHYLKLGVDAFNIHGMEWYFGGGSTGNGNIRPSFSVLSEWNTLVYGYTDAKYTFLVGQVPADINAITVSQSCKSNALYLLTYSLIPNNGQLSGSGIAEVVSNWINTVKISSPQHYPHWMLRNEATTRVAQVTGRKYVNSLNVIMMTLPGVPSTYYGEEIGMIDSTVPYEKTRDPLALLYGRSDYATVSQDKTRSPMQWNSTTNAAFTNGTVTWLPLASDYVNVNVYNQNGDASSSLSIYRNVTALRSSEAVLRTGNYTHLLGNANIYAFSRDSIKIKYVIVTVANVGTSAQTVSIPTSVGSVKMLGTGKVLCATTPSRHDNTIQLNSVQLQSGEALVIKVEKSAS